MNLIVKFAPVATMVTSTVVRWSAAPVAVAFTMIEYVPAASVVDAFTVSVELSATAVFTTAAVSPAGAPMVVYVIAVASPPVRFALIDVLAELPGARDTLAAPRVNENAGLS
jgi:hypothetical protein